LTGFFLEDRLTVTARYDAEMKGGFWDQFFTLQTAYRF